MISRCLHWLCSLSSWLFGQILGIGCSHRWSSGLCGTCKSRWSSHCHRDFRQEDVLVWSFCMEYGPRHPIVSEWQAPAVWAKGLSSWPVQAVCRWHQSLLSSQILPNRPDWVLPFSTSYLCWSVCTRVPVWYGFLSFWRSYLCFQNALFIGLLICFWIYLREWILSLVRHLELCCYWFSSFLI